MKNEKYIINKDKCTFHMKGNTLTDVKCDKDIKDLVLPDGIKCIDSFAISHLCIESIELPGSLEELKCDAIYFCSLIKKIFIPHNVIKYDHAVMGSSQLANYEVDNRNAYFKSIDGVLFSKDGTILYSFPYARTGTYRVPKSTKHIKKSAFEYSSIEHVLIPDTLLSIGDNCFCSSKLQGIDVYDANDHLTGYSLPETFTSVPDYSFDCCNQLDHFILPPSITDIGEWAFMNTKFTSFRPANNNDYNKKKDFIYSGSLLRIAECAFNGCPLEKVTLPNTLKYLDASAFNNCPITEYRFEGFNPNYKLVDGVIYSKDGEKLIAFPSGREGSFKVPECVKTIGDCAFENSILSEIIIPEGLKKIGDSALCDCKNLKSITLPEGLQDLGEDALCCTFVPLHIPNSLSKFGSNALPYDIQISGPDHPTTMAFFRYYEENVDPDSNTQSEAIDRYQKLMKISVMGFKIRMSAELEKRHISFIILSSDEHYFTAPKGRKYAFFKVKPYTHEVLFNRQLDKICRKYRGQYMVLRIRRFNHVSEIF